MVVIGERNVKVTEDSQGLVAFVFIVMGGWFESLLNLYIVYDIVLLYIGDS